MAALTQLLKDLVADAYDPLTQPEAEGETKPPTLDELGAELATRLAGERSLQLKSQVRSILQARNGKDPLVVQVQAAEGEAWQALSQENLSKQTSSAETSSAVALPEKLWAARQVCDDPQAMLEQIEPCFDHCMPVARWWRKRCMPQRTG